MELAALHHGQASKDIVDGLAEPLAAVDDAQYFPVQPEPAPNQVLQQ
jgi:hypothetical protein